ncbi:MAG: NADP oxidoreductase [Syntrophus sp. RIFOXYC2_FULL_54_9]|nr:MAG: NADP oxidoreductase [Syntrophus sp. RIFOXYC2_FULL_54_9]
MMKLTAEKLGQFKDQLLAGNALREDGSRVRITVHMGTCGIASGAKEVMDALREEIAASARKDILVNPSGCMGLCSREPLVTVECIGQEPIKYQYMDAEKTKLVFREHVLNGKVHLPFVLARGTEISD